MLVVNSRDAMPHGGNIEVRTRNAVLDREEARKRHPMEPGEYALLSVTDTGQGMDEETKAHIFEPFFTTKGVGEGTGLGLDTVQRIVKKHRGSIQIHSKPGDTRFQVWLPLASSN